MEFNPPTWLVFIGTIFVLTGAFLVLTGIQIVEVRQLLAISPGPRTWGGGLLLLLLGIVLLVIEVRQPNPSGNAVSPPLPTTFPTLAATAELPTPPVTAVPLPPVEIVRIEYLQDEYIELRNRSDTTQSMHQWTLLDSQGHTYQFIDFTLEPGDAVKLWTGSGRDSGTDLYWGREQGIWNDTGDEAALFDADGVKVTTFSYTP